MAPDQFNFFIWIVSIFLGFIGLIMLGGLWYFRENHKILISLDKGLTKIFTLHNGTTELCSENKIKIERVIDRVYKIEAHVGIN